MPYSYGREDRAEVRKWFGLGVIGWIIVVIVILLVGAMIWGLTAASSGIRGQGDAIIENNSAENWTEAQADFEQNYAEIKTIDVKIDNAYDLWQADPKDKTLQQTYTGLMSYCLSVVADYNADARSYLKEDWRATDLPSQIDTQGQFADPATDCKEN